MFELIFAFTVIKFYWLMIDHLWDLKSFFFNSKIKQIYAILSNLTVLLLSLHNACCFLDLTTRFFKTSLLDQENY